MKENRRISADLESFCESYNFPCLSAKSSRFSKLFEEREFSEQDSGFLNSPLLNKEIDSAGRSASFKYQLKKRESAETACFSGINWSMFSFDGLSDRRGSGNSAIFKQYKQPVKKQKKQGKSVFGKQAEKKWKPFQREGDWLCLNCKNLNFSFRNSCNKCKTGKDRSCKY